VILQTKNIEEFISRYQVDAVHWKADRLLSNIDNAILRNDRTREVATMLAGIPKDMGVMRDDYIKQICTRHGIKPKTMDMMITEVANSVKKSTHAEKKKAAKKNKAVDLKEDPKKFQFFKEVLRQDAVGEQSLHSIKIDKEKFVKLLSSFGFSRYEPSQNKAGQVAINPQAARDKDEFTFVRLQGNVIQSITRNQIIDHIEKFIRNEYDFAAAKYHYTDDQALISAMYDQIRTIFSKDLFARMRTEDPIIINTDTKDSTFLYYQNGFVEITKDGWKLIDYKEMNGSVWEHQMLNRKFEHQVPDTGSTFAIDDNKQVMNAGYFADFVMKVSGDNEERFKALCCLIGYVTHDYYNYKLKAVEFTDSGLSQASEGRSGKTLLGNLIGQVRSYCEINGKEFNQADKNKFEDVKFDTQVIHLNDLRNSGLNKFDVELALNDITEGIMVNAKYVTPFRHRAKIIWSTNKSLYVTGGSQRDRVIEFEMSNFFSEELSPAEYYGHWFMRDWDEAEWNKFDNFMCFCGQMFHLHGLIPPPTINLGERKLRQHTSEEFVEFMDEITDLLKTTGQPWPEYNGAKPKDYEWQMKGVTVTEFPFDKNAMYERFYAEHKADFPKLTPRWFHSWLLKFSEQRIGTKEPLQWKSNGKQFIQFVPANKKIR
jgi:hypothetical protein